MIAAGHDPDTRDRRETARVLNGWIAQYLRDNGGARAAPEEHRLTSYSWRAISPRGGGGLQLQIGTRSAGCLHFRKNLLGCLNCGLSSAAADRVVTAGEIAAQVESAFHDSAASLDGVTHVCIQGDGSFLSPAEVPPQAAYAVAERLAALPGTQTVTMETRLDLVAGDLPHIIKVRSRLASHQRLEVALGLESSSDFVRNSIFRKGTRQPGGADFVFRLLANHDIDVLAYVFIKPALLTEAEAIFDAVRTIRFVNTAAARMPHVHWTAALQPSFVQPETFLAWLYRRGLFSPPYLWSVAEIVAQSIGGPAAVHLGSPDDYPPPIATAANRRDDGSVCDCTRAAYAALLDFNRHGSAATLVENLPQCGCRLVWLEAVQECRQRRSENHERIAHHDGDGSRAAYA